MKAVICFSGGMDSTTLVGLYQSAGYDLVLVSFDYSQRHGSRELEAARQVAAYYGAEHRVINMRSVGINISGSALTDPSVDVPDGHYAEESMRATVVPNRNAIMANIAIGIASSIKADVVALGVHAGDHAIYPDCRPEFVAALRECMLHALKGFHTPRLETPFGNLTKTEIAAEAWRIDAPLQLSWSCYKGDMVHCGTCGTCVERKEAFTVAGLVDPTEYTA
jgi:7-cyano-7-deazaguanine synthase